MGGRIIAVPPNARYRSRMPKFTFQVDVRDSPAKVIGAMIDFSERRPEIWPNLTASLFQVHELGASTADVTEGSAVAGLRVWERVTYEWTDSVVRSVITEGRIYQPGGTTEFRVEPRGAGSRITFHFDRRAANVLGRVVGGLMQVTRGAVIKQTFRKVYGKPS